MKKYVKIQHPIRGTCNFDLYPFQEKALKDLVEFDLNIILKSRQMGISTLVSAYSLWLMTFFNDKNILCISITQETAKEIVTKVRFANDNLPVWLKVQCVEDNRLSLRLKNGSQIKAVSSAGTAGRSAALSLLIIDEAAFIDNIEEIWLSSQYTLSTGGRAVVLSCVTEDTYIYTSKGVQQIKELVPTEEVGDYKIDQYTICGFDRTRSGELFKVSGEVDTVCIKTKYSQLEGSTIHKIWSHSKTTGKYGWHQLDELATGDFVSMKLGMEQWGNDDKIQWSPSISARIKNKIDVDLITADWAYLFGLYISEGSAHKVYNSHNQLVGGTITITCGDCDIVDIFDRLGLKYSSHDNLHYCVSSKNLIELFESVGFNLNNHAHEKEIPTKLLRMSRDNIISMLRGIYDGGGTSSNGEVSVRSSSEKLIDQIRALLLNIGIPSCKGVSLKEKMNSYGSVKNKRGHDNYHLDIYGKYALKYFNTIGFALHRKQRNKELLLTKKISRKSSKNIIPYTLNLVNKLYTLSGENTSFFKQKFGIQLNGIVNKKTKYKTQHISQEIVLIMYETYKELLSVEERNVWDRIINNDIIWVDIKNISGSKNKVYDVSLPHTSDFWCHSVIYNGIIGHQTPNGVGNFFHKTWVAAEADENKFNTISLPWHLHPDRDQAWRDKQTELSGYKGAAQECDCSFSTSGNQVISIDVLEYYKKTHICDPIERRGVAYDLWIWQRPDYSKNYMVVADCARGDGADYSAFHVLDVETLEQVAEYKGQITTKDYGNLLVTISTEYNNALLVIENNNIGWASLQQVIDRNYPNLYYSSSDLKVVDIERTYSNRINSAEKKATPGFTTTNINRQLIINKMESFFRERQIIIHSIRLYEELIVFIWNGAKAEAMKNYNDDLVMSLGIGLWVRDTALKIRTEQMVYTKMMLGGIKKVVSSTDGPANQTKIIQNPQETWQFDAGALANGVGPITGKKESLKWLL